MQNGFCESFNGHMRDELLNESLFLGLDHARTRIADWTDDYNQRRPQVPSRFMLELTGASSGDMRLSDHAARSMI